MKMALIVGHSQAKYIGRYLQSRNIEVKSFSGFKVNQIWEHIKDIVADYNVIALLLGANDIPGNSHRLIVERFQVLCESIHDKNPRARVMLSAILPRKQNEFTPYDNSFIQDFNVMADSVNTTLHDVSLVLPWLDFIRFPEFTLRHLSRDGLHLSFKGTDMVSTVIEDIILHQLRRAPESSSVSSPVSPALGSKPSVTSPVSPALDTKPSVTTPVSPVGDMNFIGPKLYSEAVRNSKAFEANPSHTNRNSTFTNPQQRTKNVIPEIKGKQLKQASKIHRKPHHNKPKCKISEPANKSKQKALFTKVSPPLRPDNIFQLLTVEPCAEFSDDDPEYSNDRDRCDSSLLSKDTVQCTVIELPDRFLLCTDEILLKGGGYENKVYMKCETVLSWKEAKTIIDNPDFTKVTTVPPYKPNAGEVYVFSTGGDPKKIDDWKADHLFLS